MRGARTILFRALLLAAWVCVACGEEASGGGKTPEANLEHSMSLVRAWEHAYGLSEGALLPPAAITLPPNVPPPPHLEDCHARTAFRLQTEQRGPNGESPAWANGTEACGGVPQPPWVYGSDAGSLASTRLAQRDLWERQFPASCSGRRLFLTPWSPLERHGLGSQVHIMTALFSFAFAYDRVFVPWPGTYMRANQSECQDIGRNASFECYFFRMVSEECESIAMSEYAAGRVPPCQNFSRMEDDLRSDTLVVCAEDEDYNRLRLRADAARHWGDAHLHRPAVVEENGKMRAMSNTQMQVHWWRSQSVRFMLRWPSAYLCHVTNRVRNSAYGLQVAVHLLTALAEQESIVRALNNPGSENQGLAINTRAEASMFASLNLSAGSNLETEAWPGLGFRGCVRGGNLSDPRRVVDLNYEGVGTEPYVLRPIVSMHVRQGDKATEMHLMSFASFMYMANRVRRRVPHLRYIWLSTEMQSVVDQTSEYRDWTFLFSSNLRQSGTTSIFQYERDAGVARLAGISLANLLISAQCDYFVGALGSNWNRLINELKATSGRLYAGYVSVNFDEW